MTIFDELIPRLILDTETDADSPDNETTYDGIRKLIEGLILSIFATGVSGTVTGISGATLTDTGNFTTDQCNGWTLIMTSGDAIGNYYTIDDTTTNTLVCTGDDLETDGVAVGDTYVVVYDLKVNADGHDHDGVNSKLAEGVGLLSIDTAEIASEAVTLGKIENGTISSLPSAAIDGTEYSTTGDGWVNKVTHRIYIPASATILYGTFRVYRGVDGSDCFVRFQVDGNPSNTHQINATSYYWCDEIYYDCSALSAGWVNLIIDLDAQATRTSYLQGYSFRWSS